MATDSQAIIYPLDDGPPASCGEPAGLSQKRINICATAVRFANLKTLVESSVTNEWCDCQGPSKAEELLRNRPDYFGCAVWWRPVDLSGGGCASRKLPHGNRVFPSTIWNKRMKATQRFTCFGIQNARYLFQNTCRNVKLSRINISFFN